MDYDDWRVKMDFFLLTEEKWGPHSVDRFASHENTHLPRFNRFWCSGTEAVDAFSVSWAGENNWPVPPIFLIPGSSITWLTLAAALHLLFLLGLLPHFGH